MQAGRGLADGMVNRFRGINRFTAITSLAADEAVDLLNVYSGPQGLTKLRIPLSILSALTTAGLTCWGFSDFQQATGTRQIIAVFSTSIYKFDLNVATNKYTGTVLDTNALNSRRWSMVECNNILYMGNGKRMLKWTGVALQNWGITRVAAANAGGNTAVDGCNVLARQRTGGVARLTFGAATPNPFLIGNAITVINAADPSFNGAFVVTNTFYDNSHASNAWIEYTNAGPDVGLVGDATSVSITAAPSSVTRRYALSLKNSVTGHESTAILLSGPVTFFNSYVQEFRPSGNPSFPLTTDPQVDTVCLYATISNGTEYFFHSEQAFTPTQLFMEFVDQEGDALLSVALRRASFLNDPPLPGNYLAEYGGRIFVGNLDAATHDIIYSGVERILNGKQEESFPPNNRLRLGIGADDINGIGVIQAGVVAGSKSNEMFMFRGTVADIVSTDPVSYNTVLEKLPFNTGFGCHATIVSTPDGIRFLTSNRTIDDYNGTESTESFSLAANNLLRDIPEGQGTLSSACYLNYLEKDWYMIVIPTAASSKILVFDAGKNSDQSYGVFQWDLGQVDYVAIVESSTGKPQVVIAQGGDLKMIDLITRTTSGIFAGGAVKGSGALPAYWESGAWGNENSRMRKQWRKVFVRTDPQNAVTAQVKISDDRTYTLDNPLVINVSPEDFLEFMPGEFSVNRKGTRLAVRLVFPDDDVDCNVLQYGVSHIPTSMQ